MLTMADLAALWADRASSSRLHTHFPAWSTVIAAREEGVALDSATGISRSFLSGMRSDERDGQCQENVERFHFENKF